MKIEKCSRCGLFSDHDGRKVCPFCGEKIVEIKKVQVEEKPKDLSAPASPEPQRGEQVEKKVAVKTQKNSFKIWKDV